MKQMSWFSRQAIIQWCVAVFAFTLGNVAFAGRWTWDVILVALLCGGIGWSGAAVINTLWQKWDARRTETRT